MEPFFSIIMPAFNVEKYIGRAIDSVCRQSFIGWELIIIDDCSTDKTKEIVEHYCCIDSRISIIHQDSNGGVSAARNIGLKNACGQYVWFMDSDDYVNEDLLQKAFDSLKIGFGDIILFGLQEEYYNEKEDLIYSHIICPPECKYLNQDQLRQEIIYLEQQTLYGYVWNKIYKKEYLDNKNVTFPNARLNEDLMFNVQVFMDVQQMTILDFAPYHYYIKQARTSLTNSYVPEYYMLHEKRIQMILNQYIYWKMDTLSVKEILGALYGRYVLSALQRNCDRNSGMDLKKRIKWCKWVFDRKVFDELIPFAKADNSKALKIVLRILKNKNVFLCILMGRIIYIIKKSLPMIYSRGKEGR